MAQARSNLISAAHHQPTTNLGKSLNKALAPLADWGDRHAQR
jgi:DNA-binding HxlR family transcriptional regulator